jgi:hypothetical protein
MPVSGLGDHEHLEADANLAVEPGRAALSGRGAGEREDLGAAATIESGCPQRPFFLVTMNAWPADEPSR